MTEKLNILFLFADQMHAFAMGCMGNSQIHTPNLDRMAEEGVLFRNTYSNAPVCTPFRATRVTGQYGSQTDTLRNGSYFPDGTRTVAAALNDGATGQVGWVNGTLEVPETFGFHRNCEPISRNLWATNVTTIFFTV